MNPQTIEIATFVLAGLIVVAYGLFIAWRIRVHRARREQEAGRAGTASPSATAVLGRDQQFDEPGPVPAVRRVLEEQLDETGQRRDAVDAHESQPVDTPSGPPTARHTTVLEAVEGIALPLDLVPHPDAAPRPDSLDRVALITSLVPVERLRDEMDAALTAIGYVVVWQGDEGRASRPAGELRISLYDAPTQATFGEQPAFPYAGPDSAVVDLWLPR